MITNQPGSKNLASLPFTAKIGNCPPGLEYLVMVDRMHIVQAVDAVEVIFSFEIANRYRITNGVGQQIYYAFEESGCCERQFCKAKRSFVIHVVDNFQKEVLTIKRKYNCCGNPCFACCTCCQELVVIESPPGNPIGSINNVFGCGTPHYIAKDASGQVIFGIDGPNCCVMMCACEKSFFVNVEGARAGEIRKKWAGAFKELLTKADTFGVTFPMEMPVVHKAILLGATFFIDFMHFEGDD